MSAVLDTGRIAIPGAPVKAEPPPNLADILERFPGLRIEQIVFAYAPAIYAPGLGPGDTLSHPLMRHEEIHIVQQARVGGPAAWWRMYLEDDAFRLEQEIEAYRAQVRAVPNRAERRRLTAKVVKDLASPMYGRIVTKEQARRLLARG